jgi:hypothetical protein
MPRKARSIPSDRNSQEVIEEARRLFFYHAETGLILRRCYWCGKHVGEQAGKVSFGHTGVEYRYVTIFSRLYASHRVAWLLYYGTWPSSLIDHRDGDGCNNRIENLRESTKRQNGANASISRKNTSGVTGVFWDKATRKWRAAIKVNYKCIKLGRFVLFSDAVNARKDAEIKYGFSERHGRKKEADVGSSNSRN